MRRTSARRGRGSTRPHIVIGSAIRAGQRRLAIDALPGAGQAIGDVRAESVVVPLGEKLVMLAEQFERLKVIALRATRQFRSLSHLERRELWREQ